MFNVGFDPLRPWLRFQPPNDVPGFGLRVGDAPIAVGSAPLGGEADNPLETGALPPPEMMPRAWWEMPPAGSNPPDGGSEPHWPWLRAPTDEAPGFRVEPDGSARTDSQTNGVKLMSGVLAPLEPQEQPKDFAGTAGMASSDSLPSPLPDKAESPAESPAVASSVVLPAAVGEAAAGKAADLAALAARAAPVAARVGAGALAALPYLFIPNNTQSETTDLGDGLRARVRPGQRSVEIERRVDIGFFGTGIGAKWETLPVEAWQHVGSDGRVNTVINHEQLNRALGRSVPSESMGAGSSAMARPVKDADPAQPPAGTGSTADDTDKSKAPNPSATQSLAPSRIDAKALEEAKQRDPEEERVLACRRVREMPGQPAPLGQYDGPGGIDTAVGIRLGPGFPAPKGGYDYKPDYLRHFNGYKGELELKNRIEKAVPYEKIVHYGNPAGEHGPDVMTIGPQGRIMEWNSRSRQAPRRITRPGIPSVRYAQADGYVSEAIASGSLPAHVGRVALDELTKGNYDLCTVGTGNAYSGYFEAVRNHTPTGPQE